LPQNTDFSNPYIGKKPQKFIASKPQGHGRFKPAIKNAGFETYRVDKDNNILLKAFSDGKKFIRLQI